MSIRVLIADDEEVIRIGLAGLVKGDEISIVAQAADGEECLRLADRHKPDVILLDVRMPGNENLATLKKLRQKVPGSKVIMISAHDSPTHVARAVAWGASDFLLKDSPRKAIISAILAAATGDVSCCSAEFRRVTEKMGNREIISGDQVGLTARESQVLRNLAMGLSNQEISLSLKVSVETTKEHVQKVLRKLSVSDRTQAAVWAVRKGLV